MSNKLVLFFLVTGMVILHSCEYEPKDVFERKTIDNPSEATVQSVNLDLTADTIYIYSANTFIYDFSSNKKINTVRFTLDDTEQYIGNSTCNSFSFKNGSPNNGIHTLTAEVFIGSGTQSMADIVGAEGYLMSKTWVLKVDKNYYSQTYGKAIDGYLNISWPKYVGTDFVDYSIYRVILYVDVLIKRQTTIGYIDNSYVGEGGQYKIKVNRTNQGELAWGEVILQSEIPVAKLIVRDDNQYFFVWNKSKYFKAVESSNVIKDYYYSEATIVKSTQDPDDTTFHITADLFGQSVEYKLQVKPKANNLNYPIAKDKYLSMNDWGYLGHPFKNPNLGNISSIIQVSRDEFIYVLNNDSIFRYSTTLKKVVEKRSIGIEGANYIYKIMASPQKKYIYTTNYYGTALLVLNPKSLNESTSYKINGVSSDTNGPLMSDNNTIVAVVGANSYIYDLKNSNLIGTYPSKCQSISAKGDYLFLADNSFRLLKFQTPDFQPIWVKPGSVYDAPKLFEFHAINPEQLAYWDGKTFYIKQCSDFSTVYEFPLTDYSLLNIDYYNNKILCFNQGHLMVRSLLNGDLLQDIPVNISANGSIDACYLINNVIVCQLGVMYFLN